MVLVRWAQEVGGGVLVSEASPHSAGWVIQPWS